MLESHDAPAESAQAEGVFDLRAGREFTDRFWFRELTPNSAAG
jgi:hypothetical protein